MKGSVEPHQTIIFLILTSLLPDGVNLWLFGSWFELSNIYIIRLQRYKDKKLELAEVSLYFLGKIELIRIRTAQPYMVHIMKIS